MPEPKRGNRWGEGSDSEPSPHWEGVLLGLVHRAEGPEKVPHLMDGSRGMGGRRWVEGRLGEGLKKKTREVQSEKIFIRR